MKLNILLLTNLVQLGLTASPAYWTQNSLPLGYVEIRNAGTKCIKYNGASTGTCGVSTSRWQIRPFNNSATIFNIVNLGSGSSLIEASGKVYYAGIINPLPRGSTMQWTFQFVNDGSYSWNIMSVSNKTYITAVAMTAVLSPYSGLAAQRWQFFPIVPPVGRLSQWARPFRMPLVAIAATNLPDGRILAWSSSQIDNYGTGQLQTYSALYDPVSGSVSQNLITSLQADMFCPGTALLADGSVLVVGGVSSGVTNKYNGSWFKSSMLNIRRGYNAAVTLSNGNVFTLGGSWSGGLGGKSGELWTPATGWRVLPAVQPTPFLTNDAAGIFRQDNHMWLIAVSGGWVFHAGPSMAMHWVDTSGNGAVVNAGLRADDGDAMNGVAVLYDVGKVLTAGGAPSYVGGVPTANAYVIDISAGVGAPVTVRRTGNMTSSRAFHTAVVLPNGEVVVVGGQTLKTVAFQDENAVLWAEIWSESTNAFTPLAWAAGAEGMVTPRTYHSASLLLPDGRVISTGGGACGTLCMYNHLDAQILTPPYLLNPDGTPAARPTIAAAPAAAALGATIPVSAAGAASFALVRLGSTTHTVNTDQRRIPLAPAWADPACPPAAGGAAGAACAAALTIPGDAGVVVPGAYFLFALSGVGTPSVARTIMIRAQ